jgi:hypothetical protein
MTDKKTTLTSARDSRIEEVLHYQINIDNYRRAIVLAEADPDMAAFAEQLKGLLSSSIIEQKKASIMLSVIEDQLSEIG